MAGSDKVPEFIRRLEKLSVPESEPSPNFREDTPVVALARQDIVERLKTILKKKTTECYIIQKEPENAITRFLFSGITFCGDVRTDPLLPCMIFEDESIMKELTKKRYRNKPSAYTIEYANNLCHALCEESQKGIEELQKLHKQHIHNATVTYEQKKFAYQLQFTSEERNSEFIDISKFHYQHLEEMYMKHAKDIEKKDFLRRLFCVLMRYTTLGGPMYQCSCTGKAFTVMSREFGVKYECFASPFNHNADTYWSAFPDTDCFFGSKGNFFTNVDFLKEEGGSFYANPPFVEEVMERMEKQIKKMLQWKKPVSFVVVIPYWPDTSCHQWMMQQKQDGKAKHEKLPKGHLYIEGNQQTNTKTVQIKHQARFEASLFLLQNEYGKEQWPDKEDRKFKMLYNEFVSNE
jgi:phosphorylated CTD-interacting factor 1